MAVVCRGMKLLVAFAALLLAADSAHSEWVAGIYLGTAHTAKTSLRIRSAVSAMSLYMHPVSYTTNAFQSPIYYGYHAGYFFTRHFGFEGEFTHLKVYAQTELVAQISGMLRGVAIKETVPLNTVVQRFNITHGVNLLTGTFVVRTAFTSASRIRGLFSPDALAPESRFLTPRAKFWASRMQSIIKWEAPSFRLAPI